jgi:uncharacterized protein involved in exopolysaccharide biosynthesis
MISQTAEANKPPVIDESKSDTNWMTLVGQYIYHWPLFVIGLAITFTAAFFYLKTVKPVYEVKATLLIKNEKKSSDQQSTSHDVDLLNNPRIIENEIEILSSKQLISQVVGDLDLWITYQRKDGAFSWRTCIKLALLN